MIDRATYLATEAGYLEHLRVRAKASTLSLAQYHCVRLTSLWDGRDASGAPARYLTDAMVDRWVDEQKRRGMRPASINSYLRTLRAILLGAGIPEPRIVLLREMRRPAEILTDEELDCLLAGATEARDELMLLLGAHAGLRHQEIVHLLWSDFDSEFSQVRVRAKRGWTPKSYEERGVPATRLLADAARRLESEDGGEWVFPEGSGPRPVPALYDRVVPLFVHAGLYDPERKPGLHMLRRTWASNLLARGADLETVRQLGGWRSIEVVQRYLGTTSQRKRDAIALLNRED